MSIKLAVLSSDSPSLVRLEKGINISTLPQSKRISFPSPYCPSFRLLEDSDVTASAKQALNWPCVSECIDVSSSPDGVCYVTCHCVSVSNSHAGTHADTPQHFLRDCTESYADAQYTGSCVVLNVSDLLPSPAAAGGAARTITVDVLQQAAQRADVDLAAVRRLLLRTYVHTPDEWDAHFAHLNRESAEFLAKLPRLVLLGIDTPSIDHPAAAPIAAHAHGALWSGRVAILEGLDCGVLPADACVLRGAMQTVWLPTQQHRDARGCVVTLFVDE